MDKNNIRSRNIVTCTLCGAPGDIIYSGLADRLFGAPGKWGFRRCQNGGCGLLWLDPSPIPEDIGLAYASYYTHPELRVRPALDPLKYFVLRKVLWCSHFAIGGPSLLQARRNTAEMYLRNVTPGKLLDVGCGNGRRLCQLQKLGWQVVGQEMDPVAAEAARKRGISVHLGTLESAKFPSDGFEAIILSHVMEHVPDPVETAVECRRILKSTGVLVAVTPNMESYGHRLFGADWRGLEPPRHLHVFSQKSLFLLAKTSGFSDIAVWTTAANADNILLASEQCAELRCGGQPASSFQGRLRVITRQLALLKSAWREQKLDRNSGEECVLRVRK